MLLSYFRNSISYYSEQKKYKVNMKNTRTFFASKLLILSRIPAEHPRKKHHNNHNYHNENNITTYYVSSTINCKYTLNCNISVHITCEKASISVIKGKRYCFAVTMPRRSHEQRQRQRRRAELERRQEQLQDCLRKEAYFNYIRSALLDGLAAGQATADGDSQHEKLESVERAIRGILEVKQDLEVIIATLQGEAAQQ